MPRGNGIEVLTEIKKGKTDPRIIMLTNYPYTAYRLKCIEAGVDFFFDKSAEFDRVPEVVKELMQSNAS